MFGKKLVSDSLLAAVKEVTSGEQIDSSGNELLVGNAVKVQEGPHAGKTGMISGFQNTGRSEVQLNHGPSVALYNETLLNEEDADGTRPKVSNKDLFRKRSKEAPKGRKPVKLKKGSKLAKGWDPTESYDPELEEEEDTVSDFVKRGGKIRKIKPGESGRRQTDWTKSGSGHLPADSTRHYFPKTGRARGKRSEEVSWDKAQYWSEETVADFLKRGGKITKLNPRAARGSAKGKMTLKSKNPKGGGERGRKAEKKMHGEDYDIDEATAHKVGDTVIASKGPHKGIKHKIIHDHGNGKYNVQPVGLDVKHIKYRLGAATAHGKHLTPHSTNEEYEVDESRLDSHRGDKLAPEYDEAESRKQAEKNRKKWRAGNKRLNKQYAAPGKPKKIDESEMSQAEIIRRRKEQKRELVRGKRKSGKVSDKLYDYGIRKSEGKPVNVPKNTTEGLDAVNKKSLKKKWKDREDQDIDNDGDEDESDRFLHKRRKAIGKKKGEKIEINPEIKETIRKLIHSTLK